MIHIHRVPTHEISRSDLGHRWCFRCRRNVQFTLTVHAPDDPMSYYGPHASITCEHDHADGDLFPGSIREWGGEMTEPLTEKDRASLLDDLQMEERALELHLDEEPLPHLWPQHHERTAKARAEIERIKAMLDNRTGRIVASA